MQMVLHGASCRSFQHMVLLHAAVMESQAFGGFHSRNTEQAQASGAKSDTPGQIAGIQLDAATPAGHAMQQAAHANEADGASHQKQDVKAVIADWLDTKLLPAINAQVCTYVSLPLIQ